MNSYFVILEQLDGLKYLNVNKNISMDYIEFIYQGNWHVSLKENYLFEDKTKVKVLENKEYAITNYKNNEIIKMFVFINDSGFNTFELYENKDLICSKDNNSSIVFNNPYLKKDCFKIDKNILLPLIDNIYINNKRCKKETELKDGDKIECLGLVLHYYIEFIYMNKFFLKTNLNIKNFSKGIIRYNNFPKEFKPSLNYEEKNELELEEIFPFKFEFNEQALSFSQIAPGIVMSLSMTMIAGFNVYNSIQEDKEIIKIIPLIIMPITLLFTSLVLPLINKLINRIKKNKKLKKEIIEYLNYLDNSYIKIKDLIDKYIDNEKKYDFENSLKTKRYFFLNNNSSYFGTITLGNKKIEKVQSLPNADEPKIVEKLNRIEQLNKEKTPMFLRVLEHKAVSIYVNKADFFKRLKLLVLELAIKNNFNQIKIAIYSKERKINGYMAFLPHLFLDNKRLLFNDESELVKIDHEDIKVPIVLFLLDNTQYKFMNSNIHVIYLSSDRSMSYIESEIIIDYFHKEGCLFDEKKNRFEYIGYDIDTDMFYYELSQYNCISYINKTKTFKEIYKTFDIKKSYQEKRNDLIATFAYKDNMPFNIDLHESKQGPHGLIGGTTGSGKSELITSLLLSLCLRYSPDYLNIIIVDYKGGGILESLTYKGKCLPHVVASVNNIDESSFERLVMAISNECKHRQMLFNELSKLSYNSITNIDDYLNEDLCKYKLEKLPHLLIVVDEFAELKRNNEGLIKELISFSRIGRSLGIHLILATQKPSGNIDDEIWSNSRFKLALKVAETSDSQDIIKRKDAAYIKNPGEFYLLADGNITNAISLYSKADYYGEDDYEIELLDLALKQKLKKTKKGKKSLSEAHYYVNKIIETTNELSIKTLSMDFNKPRSKTINELKKEYRCKNDAIVIGEIDDYLNDKRGLLKVNKFESMFICSTRVNEHINIINQYNNEKIIVIGRKRYITIPDSFIYNEGEDIHYIFNKLLKNKEKTILIIEDINILLSYDEDYFNLVYKLLQCKNILNLTVILFSRNSQISYKILNCFNNKYIVESNNIEDTINIFNTRSIYKTNSYYMEEMPKSFVPALLEKEIMYTNKLAVIKRIPKIVKQEPGKLFLGYNYKTREKVYLNESETLTIVSNEHEQLEMAKEIYKTDNINFQLYDNSLLRDKIDNFLWIGSDTNNQRLFYINRESMLKENEGFYMRKGELIKLRLIDYA